MPRATRPGEAEVAPFDLPRFHELDGIGPALEARLHAAGVTSWRSFGEILAALARVRSVSPDTLRALAAEATARDDDAADGTTRAGRRESFLVRLTMGAGGRAERTTAVHVNAGTERQWPGWSPDGLLAFVRDASRLVEADVTFPAVVPGEPPRWTHDEEATSTLAGPSGAWQLTVPMGHVIGGAARDIDLVVPAHDLGRSGRTAYLAALVGRPIGRIADAGAPPLAEAAGETDGHELRARFVGVTLPAGVHTLEARIELGPLATV